MRIRMKASSWNGLLRKKTYKGKIPIAPGCKNEAALHALNEQFDRVSGTEWAKLVEEVFLKQKEVKVNAPVVLEMQLNHGDMVVMNGADIQKYYEVSDMEDPTEMADPVALRHTPWQFALRHDVPVHQARAH